MKTQYQQSSRNSQSGIYYVLGVAAVVALLIVAAAIFGLGRITADRARLQAINNLISMAAIQGFMDCSESTKSGPNRVPGCNSGTYSGKADAAAAAANRFAELNSLQGTASQLGDLKLASDGGGGEGGSLHLGRWIQSNEDGNTLCNSNPTGYPCFVENDNNCQDLTADGCGVTAIKIDFNTQPTNPILVPLGHIVGKETFAIHTSAIATVIPRCMAFVLDVSGSSSVETHQQEKAAPYRTSSYFAIRSSPEGGPPRSFADCSTPTDDDSILWCKSYHMGNHPSRTSVYDSAEPLLHYKSDYFNPDTDPVPSYAKNNGDHFGAAVFPQSVRENLVYDRYVSSASDDRAYDGPEPLVSFLKAVNSGIQEMRKQAVGGDKAMVLGFRSAVSSTAIAQLAGRLDNNFGFLLQLTNPDNRGIFTYNPDGDRYREVAPELRPNFLDADWFPRKLNFDEVTGTNLYDAMETALNSLSQCPTESKKMMIVATDGIPNCSGPNGFDGTKAEMECKDNTFSAYQYNETRMLDLNPGSLLSRLMAAKVAVTVLLRGKSVRPNFINVESPSIPGTAMDQVEARSLGYGGPLACPGGPVGCTKMFFKYTAGDSSSDEAGLLSKNSGGIFYRPNGLMGEIAFRTGGVWCPLLDKSDDVNAYETINGIPTLKNSTTIRVPGTVEVRPLYNLKVGGQAVKCIKDAIGPIPFTLVEGQ